MSNKAINKFAKFTATKPPSYKYNRLGPSSIKKHGQSKIIQSILDKKAGLIDSKVKTDSK